MSEARPPYLTASPAPEPQPRRPADPVPLLILRVRRERVQLDRYVLYAYGSDLQVRVLAQVFGFQFVAGGRFLRLRGNPPRWSMPATAAFVEALITTLQDERWVEVEWG